MDRAAIYGAAKRALAESGLRARNWSGPDAVVLALYEDGDSFLGTVTLGETCRAGDEWYKRAAPHLARFSAAYNHAITKGDGT